MQRLVIGHENADVWSRKLMLTLQNCTIAAAVGGETVSAMCALTLDQSLTDCMFFLRTGMDCRATRKGDPIGADMAPPW